MTRTTNARLAGCTFLFYIAVGITSMIVAGGAASGVGPAAKLASIAQHVPQMRIGILLNLLTTFSAIVLGVALYGITREEDQDLAALGLACRVGEGLLGASGIPQTLSRLWLATAGADMDAAARNAIGTYLLMPDDGTLGAIFFSVGSAVFCYLLLRGRIVPVPLAWFGLVASVLLVVTLPLQLVGLVKGPFTSFLVMWMPMLVFELAVAFWLLVKGAAAPTRRT